MSTVPTPTKAPTLLTAWSHHDDEEVEQKPLDFALIARLYRYTQPHARKRTALLVSAALRSVQMPCLTWIIAAVIKGPIADGNMPGTLLGAGLFLALAVITQFTMYFRQSLALELGEAVVCDLRNDIFRRLQQMPMRYFHTTKLGRIISRMLSDVEDVRVGVQEVLFVTLVALGQMLVASIFMLWYDWTLFLLVLCLAPALWGINRYFHRRLSAALRAVRDSFSRVTATLAESVNGVRVTQAYVRQDANARMFGALVADHSRYNFRAMRIQGLYLPLLDLNNQVFVALVLLVGGFQVLRADATADVGNLVGFFFMATMFFSPINHIGNQYNQALTAMAGAERVFKLIDQQPEWTDPPTAQCLPKLVGRVEFRHLNFEYERRRPVLHDICAVVEPGQTVALVGATGSGKTSIINLVAKFYLPTSGQLLVDGHEIRTLGTDWLHTQLGIVLQQNFLFTGTVRNNIRFGRPEASDDDVRRVLAQLDCLDLFDALPAGLDAQVGERGANLSLGQRQLTCFARAMLVDPRILILDEATSNVDALTEGRVQRALELLLAGRTSFVVAHRLSTVRHAHLVLVLKQGRIVERGTHDELVARQGVYAGLYQRFTEASSV